MSKIQGYKRIIVEDFEEKDRNLVSKLSSNINVFAEEVGIALNKNLTIQDNLAFTQKEFVITVNANGVPRSPTSISSNLQGSCKGTQVIRAINQTTPSLSPTSCPFITFVDNNGQVNINKITGLQPDNKYLLTVILYP